MMSSAQMNRLADDAAARAKRNGLKPKAGPFSSGNQLPFLGDYVPKGYRRIDAPNPPREMGCADGYLFVDASGFGDSDEPALTRTEFSTYVAWNPTLLFGICEAGQFQVVVGVYERIAS